MADLEETLKSSPKFLLPKLASMRTAQWRCTRPQVENSGEWLEEPSQCGRSAWRWFARRRGPWMVVRRSWWASSLHPSCAAWAGTRSYQTENYHMHEVTMLLANRNIHMSVFTGLQNSSPCQFWKQNLHFEHVMILIYKSSHSLGRISEIHHSLGRHYHATTKIHTCSWLISMTWWSNDLPTDVKHVHASSTRRPFRQF